MLPSPKRSLFQIFLLKFWIYVFFIYTMRAACLIQQFFLHLIILTTLGDEYVYILWNFVLLFSTPGYTIGKIIRSQTLVYLYLQDTGVQYVVQTSTHSAATKYIYI
jgi:hypothetical protein